MITGAYCRMIWGQEAPQRDLAPVVFVAAGDTYADVNSLRLDTNGWLVVERMSGRLPSRIPPCHVNAIFTTPDHDETPAATS